MLQQWYCLQALHKYMNPRQYHYHQFIGTSQNIKNNQFWSEQNKTTGFQKLLTKQAAGHLKTSKTLGSETNTEIHNI